MTLLPKTSTRQRARRYRGVTSTRRIRHATGRKHHDGLIRLTRPLIQHGQIDTEWRRHGLLAWPILHRRPHGRLRALDMIHLRHCLNATFTHTRAHDRGGDGLCRGGADRDAAQEPQGEEPTEIEEEVRAGLPGERDAVHFARGDGAAGFVGGTFFTCDQARWACEWAVLSCYVLGGVLAADGVRRTSRPRVEAMCGVILGDWEGRAFCPEGRVCEGE